MPGIDFSSFDHLNDAVVITDGELDPPGPRILHVNSEFTRMTGYEADEVIGKTPRIFQGPKTDRGALDRLKDRLSRGRDVAIETVNYRKDGSEYGVEWYVKPIRDARGEISHYLSVQRNVTERMQERQAVFARKDRLEAILAAVGEALFVTDIEGRVTQLNPAATHLTGWTLAQAKGRSLAEVLNLRHCLDEKPAADLAQRSLGERRTLEPREPFLLKPRRGPSTLVRLGLAPIRPEPLQVDGLAVWLRRVEAEAPIAPTPIESPRGARSVSRNELLRRLGRVLESAQELGSVHALAILEVETNGTADDARELRRQTLQALRARVRQSDSLAELDDHRYGLILHHCPLEKATAVARSLLDAVRAISGDTRAPCVVGLVPFTAEDLGVEELLERGRQTCREAWILGGNRIQVFRSDSSDRARLENEILRAVELLQAIDGNRLQLFGQEIVPLRPGLQRHVEVLLRMPGGDGGYVPPSAFILAAERYEMSSRLDNWVVTTALARYRRLFPNAETGISINLSGKSVGDEALLDLLHRHLPEYGVPAERVCFEITETAAISDLPRARRFIDALRNIGCRFALDDFGSGHASFRYLKELEVDYLKIDRHFVRDICEKDFDLAMIESMLRIGRVLGVKVIAEGVESDRVCERLRDLGVDYAQGYVHGHPCPLGDLRGGLEAPWPRRRALGSPPDSSVADHPNPPPAGAMFG